MKLDHIRLLLNKVAAEEPITLTPDQETAVHKVVSNPYNTTILAHAVGSGKTLEAVAAFERLKQAGRARKALVVTPASLRDNFIQNGIKKLSKGRHVILGTKEESRNPGYAHLDEVPDSDYYVTSYDLFRKHPEKYLMHTGADTVIYDELHRARNNETEVYKAIKKARPLHQHAIGLTGSIVNNSPVDAYNLVDALTGGKHDLGTAEQFSEKYLHRSEYKKGVYGHVIGLKNHKELGLKLTKYIHYLGMEDIPDHEMPSKKINTIKVPMGESQYKAYQLAVGKIPKHVGNYMRDHDHELAGKNNSRLLRLYNAMTQARKISNTSAGYKSYDDLSKAVDESPKVKRLISDLEEHLHKTPDGRSIIYSPLLHGGMDVIKAGLDSKKIPYGEFIGKGNKGITEDTRQSALHDFNEGKHRVLLISGAGSEGISAPNTTMVQMLEGHFNPEIIHQTEARGVRRGGLAHRPENKRQVEIRRYISTAPGGFFSHRKEPTIDERMYNIAAKKDKINSELRQSIRGVQRVDEGKANLLEKVKYKMGKVARTSLLEGNIIENARTSLLKQAEQTLPDKVYTEIEDHSPSEIIERVYNPMDGFFHVKPKYIPYAVPALNERRDGTDTIMKYKGQ